MIAALIMGCEEKRYTESPFTVDWIDRTPATNCFEVLCDEDMYVVYIFRGCSKAGLSVRVDSTGAPVRCSAIRRWRRRR